MDVHACTYKSRFYVAAIPPISLSSLKFLESLTEYYRSSPCIDSDESSDEVDDPNYTSQEPSEYEMKRIQAIERNKKELKRLGLDNPREFLSLNVTKVRARFIFTIQ